MCKCTEKHIMYESLTNFHIFLSFENRKQLEECIEIIGDADFPTNWGIIITQIKEAFNVSNDVYIYAGLCATFRLVTKHVS